MDFGITIKPDLTIDRVVSLTRQAESQAALVLLLRKYPDTLERLETVGAG